MKEFHKKEAPIVGYAGFGGGTSFLSKPAGGSAVDITEHFKSLRRTVTSDEDTNHYSGLWDSGLVLGEYVTGEVVFDVPGTYTWTVPNGVSVITVVTVGGGGAGQQYSAGGGGGALAYGNNISVTAGQNITVVVGHGGQNAPNPGSYPFVQTPGGTSYVLTPPGAYAARASGGTGGNRTSGPTMAGSGGPGGTVQNGGGGSGGDGGSMPNRGSGYATAGGGGAGGYSGNGGNGGNAGDGYAYSGISGSGGGAGGGSGSWDAPPNRGAAGGGEGGGVGIYGQGSNGAGGPNANATNGSTTQPGVGGGGGSGGTDGGYEFGSDGAGLYGGGGANGYVGGMSGAVRIIWPGNTRSFPSTSVAKGSYDSSYENVNDYLVMAKIQGLNGRIFTGLNGNGSRDEYNNWGSSWSSNNQGENDFDYRYNKGRRPIREGKVGWNKITSTRNNGYSEVVHFFKKGDGFFNMFSYTGNGNNTRDITHGLSKKPGFIIVLGYTESTPPQWRSFDASNSNTSFGSVTRSIQNDTSNSNLSYGYISAVGNSSFTVTNGSDGSNPTRAVNKNGNRYDVIVFENSSICKTGYYTGTGSDQTISTGFANGIQFFMYKRLNSDANPGGEWTYITGDLKTSGNNYGELLRGDNVKETKNMIESSGSNLTLKTNGSNIDYNSNGGQYVFLAVAAPSS